MLNTESAYKVLTNILASEKLVMESFWEDDEERLPDLPNELEHYKIDLFYSVLSALKVSLVDFCDNLNARYTRLYVIRPYGRIAAMIKGSYYCLLDENMLELLHTYVFKGSSENA